MFGRTIKNEMISHIRKLPSKDIPMYLEENSNALAYINSRQANEIAEEVMAVMLQGLSSEQHTQFEVAMATVMKYFNAAVFAPKFHDYVKKYVVDALPFIEKHANEISAMFRPEQLLQFLSDVSDNIFDPYPLFSLFDVCSNLSYEATRSYTDEWDRVHVAQRWQYQPCQLTGFNLFTHLPGELDKLLEEFGDDRKLFLDGGLKKYSGSREINLKSADEIYHLCKSRSPLAYGEKNINLIRDAKAKFDEQAAAVAVSNLAKAEKLISLFNEKFSAVHDIFIVKQFMAKVKVHDEACAKNVVSATAQNQCSLAIPFLRAMRRVVKRKDMDAMLDYVGEGVRANYLHEQSQFLRERNNHGLRFMLVKPQSQRNENDDRASVHAQHRLSN